MHEWPLLLIIAFWTIRIWRTHHSNINASMTFMIIRLWTIRIWRTHHSNTNACMNDRYCTLLLAFWTIRIWRTHHSNINASMTAIIIPLWTIRIWRTHHSNTNAYMNDRYCSLLHFEPYAFDVHTTVISCINDRYHYSTLNHTHLTYTLQ